MERLMQRLALLLRAEVLAVRLQTRRAARASVFIGAALVAALFAFAFVNYCVFLWIAGTFGTMTAGWSLAAIDIALAGVFLALGSSRAPSQQEAMVEELRAMALAELESDARELKDRVVNIQQHVARISDGISKVTSSDPLQIGLGSIGPIISLVARLIHRRRDE